MKNCPQFFLFNLLFLGSLLNNCYTVVRCENISFVIRYTYYHECMKCEEREKIQNNIFYVT